ncbi:MAG: cation:proton antiporter subunit C [Wolbachia endosymbiont of Tyrophagus putrescentiae]|nr:cation:proton antiporter subunit C [Wolbachia endosymbiont of Tyrophagus putrescentiae]
MTLYNYMIIMMLMILGLYIIICDKNLIKKMMGMSIFQASILLFYISLGYIKDSLPPVLNANSNLYSNPIPHVLMLTAIVVGIATFSVGLSIAVRIKEKYGTINMNS